MNFILSEPQNDTIYTSGLLYLHVLTYYNQVDTRIQDEDLRCTKFFHPVSYSRVIRECEARMVEDYIPYLQGECRQMVKDENRPGKYGVYIFNVFVHIATVMVNLGTLNLTLEIVQFYRY